MKKRHRHRLDPLHRDVLREPVQSGFVERTPDRSVRPDPLCDLEPHMSRNQWFGLHVLEIVEPGYAQPSHLENVAKALGRNQREARSTLLENYVRCDRCRMYEGIECRAVLSRLVEDCRKAVNDRVAVIRWGGKNLV